MNLCLVKPFQLLGVYSSSPHEDNVSEDGKARELLMTLSDVVRVGSASEYHGKIRIGQKAAFNQSTQIWVRYDGALAEFYCYVSFYDACEGKRVEECLHITGEVTEWNVGPLVVTIKPSGDGFHGWTVNARVVRDDYGNLLPKDPPKCLDV